MNTVVACSKTKRRAEEILIKTHIKMVKQIAHHFLGRLPYSVHFEDLIQAGMLGLLEAVKHYDSNKGASFATYAGIRIRGHILDEMRRNDWIPRSVHRNARLIADAVQKVENRLGREAKDSEVAQQLNIKLDEYYEMVQYVNGGQLYGFDDIGLTDDFLKEDNENASTEPHVRVLQNEMISLLTKIMDNLPTKERLVLSLYYQQDLNLKEIGQVLGVSESRVSQIHSQATMRIRACIELRP